MSKLTANINIGDFDECKISHDILCDILQNEDINVGIRLKYINEYNQKLEKENNMNIPFVRVNNKNELERVTNKMERETGLNKLVSNDEIFFENGYKIVGIRENFISIWHKNFQKHAPDKTISADEYLTGIKTNFTLSDLEDGMVVELRDNSNKFMVLNNNLYGENTYFENLTIKENFNCNLSNIKREELDIVKVYKLNSNILHFTDYNLTLIFDAETHRNKSKISQRKLEIKNEIEKLEKELKSLEV